MDEGTASGFLPESKETFLESSKPFLRKGRPFISKPAITLRESQEGIIPAIELPGIQSNISMDIIKGISLSLSNKSFPFDDQRSTFTDLRTDQSMKLNLKGVIGDRLNILIKYDDTQRDFSIDKNVSLKYAGKQGEILNYIEAGNINLSIPNTQFISFSKNFFGIKGKLIFDKLPLVPGSIQMYPIIGVSENQTSSSTFRGNTASSIRTYYDRDYAKNSIFALYRGNCTDRSELAWEDLKYNFFGKYRIVANTEKIYFDDRIGTNNTQSTIASGPFQGGDQIWNFDRLLMGEDYFIDTLNGLLYMQKSVSENHLAIAAFQIQSLSDQAITEIGKINDTFIDQNSSGYFLDDPKDAWDAGIPPDVCPEEDFLWWEGAESMTFTGTDDYHSQFRFIKKEQNRFMGNSLVNFYRTGITGISADDMIIRIVNLNDSDGDNDPAHLTLSTGKKISYLTIFGLDIDPIDGLIDKEFIDTDNGYLIFPDATPFDLTDNDTFNGYLHTLVKTHYDLSGSELEEIISISNKQIYSVNDEYDISRGKFVIEIEYSSPQKIFYLGNFNIKEDSEVVKVDGIIRRRNSDYTLDYRTGTLTFINEEILKGNANVEITYEYEPFIISQQKYVLGNRLEWRLNNNFFIGSTVLNEEFMKKPTEIPEPGEEPQSKFVFGVDSSLKITSEFLKKTIFSLPLLNRLSPAEINVSAEYAYSYNNPNTFNQAAIDSMEKTTTLTTVNMDYKTNWYLSSQPVALSTQETRAKTVSIHKENPAFFTTDNEFRYYSIDDTDVHPYTPEETEFTTASVKKTMYIELNGSNSWSGITGMISRSNIDISKLSSIDFWIKNLGNLSDATIHVDIGLISEDADGDGFLDTEDKDKDGYLGPTEDTGITFDNGFFSSILGKDDGYLNSEDLDRNGILNISNRYFTYSDTILQTISSSDGWQFVSIPLVFDTKNKINNPDVTMVRYIRIWVENHVSNNSKFKIQDLALAGNKWEKGVVDNAQANEYFSILVASQDDPRYSAFFDREDKKNNEALILDFYLIGNSTETKKGYTKIVRHKALNISNYNNIEISTLGHSMPDTDSYQLYFHIGIDENNYWKIPVNVRQGSGMNDWHTTSISINELHTYERTGNPNFLNVKYMSLQIEAQAEISGSFFVNNILLSDPNVLKDNAIRGNVSTNLLGMGPLMLSYSNVGSDFSPMGVNRTGTRNEQISASFTMNTIKRAPITLGYSRNTSTIENILDFSQSSTTIRSQSESFRISTTLNLAGIIFKNLPAISYSFSVSNSEAFGLLDSQEISTSKITNEIHTLSTRMNSFLFLFNNLNLSLGRNISKNVYNYDFDPSKKNTTSIRNNMSLSFNLLTIQNSITYSDNQRDGLIQNDNLAYNASSNLRLIRFLLEPNLSIRGNLGRNYYSFSDLSGIARTNVRFSTAFTIRNRFGFASILNKVKFLSINTITVNASYEKSNSSDINNYDGIFPILMVLDILSGKLEENMYSNLVNQERYNVSMNYAPFRTLQMSGSYDYRISDTIRLGSKISNYIHTISSNANFTGLDRFIKFLKRSTLTLSFNYNMNLRSGSDYIVETYNPSLSFPIVFSNNFNQSLRVNYSHIVETRLSEINNTTNLTFSSSWDYRFQLKYGLKLPFIKRINLQNAINAKLNLSYSMARTDKLGSTESNSIVIGGGFDYRFSRTFYLVTNLTYTISDNLTEKRHSFRELKLTVGGNIVF